MSQQNIPDGLVVMISACHTFNLPYTYMKMGRGIDCQARETGVRFPVEEF